MTHKSCEERADGLTLKIDGERVERRTQKIREERADGLTHNIMEERARIDTEARDDDGSESGGCRWTNTSTTLMSPTEHRGNSNPRARRTVYDAKRLGYEMDFKSLTSTEFALRKWVESLNWVVTQSGVCSSFVEIENEVHDEECWRGWVPDESWHDAAAATLTDWKSWNKLALLLVEICEGSQEGGIQGDVRDRNGAQNTSVEEEENWSIPRTIRIELALPRNLEKEKSIETGAAPGQDQGECRDGESSQENAEQAFQLEINCKGRKSRIYFSQNTSETSTPSQKNRRS